MEICISCTEAEKREVLEKVSQLGIEFINFQFTDIFGILKSVSVTTDELESALDGYLMFDGSSVDGFARIDESDRYLVPDPKTLEIMPWRPREKGVARMICDVHTPQGDPFSGCPRNTLKRILREAQDMDFELNVGPEGEFFLFHTDEKDQPTMNIHDKAGYFDMSPVDKGEDARRDIVLTMKKMGFRIETSHHEVAPGQHEVDFKYDEALRTADNWVTFRDIVKNIALSHNLYATFMPKPLSGQNGSAMHCNQSLFQGEDNIFHDPNTETELSQVALYYIGGLLKHARGITAFANPTVNSYKRLRPGYEAPTNISWSSTNRSALIRIPNIRGKATRVEYRSPDPTANPYLVFAIMLKAGLDGIKNKITPPQPVNGELEELVEQNKVEQLPQNLYEALQAAEQDPLIREAVGAQTFQRFLEGKYREWDEYAEQVHRWEINSYLDRY